jgi:hypothetical protein
VTSLPPRNGGFVNGRNARNRHPTARRVLYLAEQMRKASSSWAQLEYRRSFVAGLAGAITSGGHLYRNLTDYLVCSLVQPAATRCLSWVESPRYGWRTTMNDRARLAAIASATAASMLWSLAAFSQSPPNRDSCDRALSLREPAINAAHQVVDQCIILCRQVVVQEQRVGTFWEMCIRQGQANAQRPSWAHM